MALTSSNKRSLEDDVAGHVPGIDELDEMRRERGIKAGYLSESMGYSPTAWERGASNGTMSPQMRLRALLAFEFHDRAGYLPLQAYVDAGGRP